jgi:hypothetical protein
MISFTPLGIAIFNDSPIVELCLQKNSVQPSIIHGCASKTVITVQSVTGLSRWVYELNQKRIITLPFWNSQQKHPVHGVHAIFEFKGRFKKI